MWACVLVYYMTIFVKVSFTFKLVEPKIKGGWKIGSWEMYSALGVHHSMAFPRSLNVSVEDCTIHTRGLTGTPSPKEYM